MQLAQRHKFKGSWVVQSNGQKLAVKSHPKCSEKSGNRYRCLNYPHCKLTIHVVLGENVKETLLEHIRIVGCEKIESPILEKRKMGNTNIEEYIKFPKTQQLNNSRYANIYGEDEESIFKDNESELDEYNILEPNNLNCEEANLCTEHNVEFERDLILGKLNFKKKIKIIINSLILHTLYYHYKF